MAALSKMIDRYIDSLHFINPIGETGLPPGQIEQQQQYCQRTVLNAMLQKNV